MGLIQWKNEFSVGDHFSFEEKFMADAEYSNIEAHCQMHDNFSKKLDQLSLQFHREEHVLTSEIIKSIENWLVYHILL